MFTLNKVLNDINDKCKKFDYIMIHSDITELLYLEDFRIVREKFFDLFKKLIKNNKTLIIPTFNWDFCKGVEYNYLTTQTKVGTLSKWCLENELFERTNDPVYSCCVSGINKTKFLNIEYKSAFEKDSIFDKINNLNSIVVDINCERLTISHYYERKYKVPYRYDKNFTGYVLFKNNMKKKINYSFYVRSQELNPITNDSFDKYKNYKSVKKTFFNKNFSINYVDINTFKSETEKSVLHDKYFFIINKLDVINKTNNYNKKEDNNIIIGNNCTIKMKDIPCNFQIGDNTTLIVKNNIQRIK